MSSCSPASSMCPCKSPYTLYNFTVYILIPLHRLFLQSPANPDLLYIIFFCHTQLTVTLLLALIFGSKVRAQLQTANEQLYIYIWYTLSAGLYSAAQWEVASGEHRAGGQGVWGQIQFSSAGAHLCPSQFGDNIDGACSWHHLGR